MSDLSVVSRTLTLKFSNQQYTNSYIDVTKTDEEIYNFGMAINAFQDGSPEQVIETEKSLFMNA